MALLFGTAIPSPAQVEAQRWVLSGTLRQTFTDNLFLVEEGPGEAITGATLGLSYLRIGRSSAFSARGWANGSLYSRFTSYDDLQFGFGLAGRKSLGPLARLRYSAAYANGLNLEALYSYRVGLPQIDTKSFSVASDFTYDFTPSTSGNLAFDANGVRYRADVLLDSAQLPADFLTPPDVLAPIRPETPDIDSPVPPDGSLQALGLLSAEGIRTFALDYWTWRAGGSLSHEFSPRTRLLLNSGYRRTYESSDFGAFVDGEQIEAGLSIRQTLDPSASLALSYAYQDARFTFHNRTHSVQLQGDKRFNEKVKGDLTIGGNYFDGPSDESSGWTLTWGAGLSLRLKRTFMAVRYSRNRYQGLILGRSQVADQVFGSLGHRLGKRVFGSAFGYYRDSRDDVSNFYSYHDMTMGASLSARIKRRGFLGVSYSYSRFSSSGFPEVSRSVLSFSLGYSRVMK